MRMPQMHMRSGLCQRTRKRSLRRCPGPRIQCSFEELCFAKMNKKLSGFMRGKRLL